MAQQRHITDYFQRSFKHKDYSFSSSSYHCHNKCSTLFAVYKHANLITSNLICLFYLKTRKATGFKPLQGNCREINQVTSKYQVFENEKSEHQHRILHIRFHVKIRFQLKLTILTFWTKFSQNGYFRSKTEKVNTSN